MAILCNYYVTYINRDLVKSQEGKFNRIRIWLFGKWNPKGGKRPKKACIILAREEITSFSFFFRSFFFFNLGSKSYCYCYFRNVSREVFRDIMEFVSRISFPFYEIILDAHILCDYQKQLYYLFFFLLAWVTRLDM